MVRTLGKIMIVKREKFEQFHVINDLRNIFKSVNEYVNII